VFGGIATDLRSRLGISDDVNGAMNFFMLLTDKEKGFHYASQICMGQADIKPSLAIDSSTNSNKEQTSRRCGANHMDAIEAVSRSDQNQSHGWKHVSTALDSHTIRNNIS